MASLVVLVGKSRGSCFTLEARPMVAGRDEACDIQVVDEMVSRRHLEVAPLDGDRFQLTDLGSANGVFINDRRIAESAVLHDNDVIVIGESKLLYTLREFESDQAAMMFFKRRGEHEKNTLMVTPDSLQPPVDQPEE